MNLDLKLKSECKFCHGLFNSCKERDDHQRQCRIEKIKAKKNTKKKMAEKLQKLTVESFDQPVFKGMNQEVTASKSLTFRSARKRRNEHYSKTKLVENIDLDITVSTNMDSDLGNPNNGGQCRYCEKKLPTSRRLSIDKLV